MRSGGSDAMPALMMLQEEEDDYQSSYNHDHDYRRQYDQQMQQHILRFNLKYTIPLEKLWHYCFDYYILFLENQMRMKGIKTYVPEPWILVPVATKPKNSVWHEHQEVAKVHFICQNCNNAWTSKYGLIKFWWNPMSELNIPNNNGPVGCVAFQLYGQGCKGRRGQGCNQTVQAASENSTNNYQDALWYPDEVDRVLWNLSVAVARQYDPDYEHQPKPVNRPSKPTKPHDSDECEACKCNACPSLLRR